MWDADVGRGCGTRVRDADVGRGCRAGPELAGPELAGPELAGPELAGPELAGPELSWPGSPSESGGPARPSRLDGVA